MGSERGKPDGDLKWYTQSQGMGRKEEKEEKRPLSSCLTQVRAAAMECPTVE